jgi:hypothetical protein
MADSVSRMNSRYRASIAARATERSEAGTSETLGDLIGKRIMDAAEGRRTPGR